MASFRTQIAALNTRIATLTAKRDELVALAETTVEVNSVNPGDVITFTYGRKTENASPRILTGTVLGVKVPEDGKKGGTIIKVIVGSGIDTEVVSIFPSAIKPSEEEQAEVAAEVAAQDSADAADLGVDIDQE